ncbi:hypothetical protein [Flavobacterium subsaxonicum]|uniref:Uncharacterized protein n=1 Tax=Flavobacterium subsaxonicum WB 4.1-42 = DSM 21790 TaxID=1121898 RepID=A0A0A2MIW5_9FLAO|nr:hypothetical protein [Flavobacterium subsaxonicum]KGO92214.1 hypothetical protein Q766_13715 [Flavobacterium subsaxonicum WB 4.1-42 = DSM 21790]
MEFNTIIKAYLLPILIRYGFKIEEEFKNVIRFRSSAIKVNIVFSTFENSHFVEIGENIGELYPLDDNVAKNLFVSELSLDQVAPEVFLQNLSLLFQTELGGQILKGYITPLKIFVLEENKKYTDEIIHNQRLEKILKSWNSKNYKAFVDEIKDMDFNKLPPYFLLKYRIAQKKL